MSVPRIATMTSRRRRASSDELEPCYTSLSFALNQSGLTPLEALRTGSSVPTTHTHTTLSTRTPPTWYTLGAYTHTLIISTSTPTTHSPPLPIPALLPTVPISARVLQEGRRRVGRGHGRKKCAHADSAESPGWPIIIIIIGIMATPNGGH